MGMGVCTKTNGFKAVSLGVVLFVLLNVLFNYFSGDADDTFSFSKLSIKRVTLSSSHILYNRSEESFVQHNGNGYEEKTNPPEFNITESNDIPAPRVLTNSKTWAKISVESRTNNNSNNSLPICKDPKPNSGGPIKPNISLESLDFVQQRLSSTVMMGGWYRPTNCIAKFRVAIIVPFRDRYAHLSIFLKNIHPFLMKQNIEYRIFVIEQTNGKLFNRAALMNIGYLEALKILAWDCFVFHDVDLLPLDERNLYTCPNQPRHMSVAIDVFGYKLPYSSIFGGVSGMTREHFSKVNGFSNSFWGWGGEDDDMSNRLKHANLFISRYPVNIARYMMLTHQKERANPKSNHFLLFPVQNFTVLRIELQIKHGYT
ncbi:beta-1,4-N-acetylgalactosaminyltransferase bre-4 isoform X2 [Episyrphus balteatus]|uniref:beta-1,4-N-acetylgalactosaminyltransferase bre-4 isoform X2 n=1 Tax=Episyrphus balteatus TaxID=286459 RepID=UPI0024857B27|nr:beta-1,4-N-acetylgalactosaminyltransferase bre-4 isoform X2 [Episyrphus balteatus]